MPKGVETPPIKVLLVDDEPNALESYAQYLNLSGYNVVTAVNGVQALETLRRERPDIVFLDIRMPEMDGWEVCERIKKDPTICATPVIFLTAFDQIQDRERARRLCVQGYITKPCDPSEIINHIRSCIIV